MGTQICSRCKTEKPFSEYHKRSANKSGLNGMCKECDNKRKRELYRNQDPVERQIMILAKGILSRTSGRIAKKQYYDRGIECKIGKNITEVMDYLRENFSEDITSMLDREEQVTVDRIDSAGHYEAGNVRIMEFGENSLGGGRTSQKLLGHTVIIRDLETGETTKAPSIKTAAKIIGCTHVVVSKRFKHNNPAPIFGRYKITRESE